MTKGRDGFGKRRNFAGRYKVASMIGAVEDGQRGGNATLATRLHALRPYTRVWQYD